MVSPKQRKSQKGKKKVAFRKKEKENILLKQRGAGEWGEGEKRRNSHIQISC